VKLNAAATAVAEKVHVREIVVISDRRRVDRLATASLPRFAGSLAVARLRRYKRRNSPKAR
jgi:hypothetical protein